MLRFNGKKGAFFLAAACLLPFAAAAQVKLVIDSPHYLTAIDDEQQQQAQVDAVPGDAALVDGGRWDNQRDATVKDITDYIPGVFAQPHDGAESLRLSVRGSGLADIFQGRGLLVMEDGIPLNFADGEFEFAAIDPWLIRYAQVFPGANALPYGASAFGGAINFVTPNGLNDPGYSLRAEAGSFGTLHGQLAAGRQWEGGDLFASALGFAQEGDREHNQQDTSRFTGNWGWQAGDDFMNRVYVSHIHSDAQIPGALSMAEIGQDVRMANPNNIAGDYQRNLDITRVADKSAWVNGADRVETAVFYTYRTLDNPVTTYEFQTNNDVGAQARYMHSFGGGLWLFGVNSYYGTADEDRFKNLGATPSAHILSRNLYAQTNEAYGQVEYRLVDSLYGIAGAQAAGDMRDITQSFPTSGAQNEYYQGFSPRLGLRYDFSKETQAFANLSRSFEPPSWNELSGGNNPGFVPLKSQRGTTAEVGARGTEQGLHWQAAYYHGWLKDELVNYRFADGDTATINADKSTRDGIELGLAGDAARNILRAKDAVTVTAAYTFSHFNLDHDPLYGNNSLPGVPEHYLRAEALYRHPWGLSFGPNVEWSPKAQPVDLANTFYASGYAIMGARAFWESEDGRLSFYIEGRNLFNRTYIATLNAIPDALGQDGRNFYPGEGASVYTGFHFRMRP